MISVTNRFHVDGAVKNKVMQIIKFVILDVKPFEIEFRGLIVSNGAILIKGYYREGLSELRAQHQKICYPVWI